MVTFKSTAEIDDLVQNEKFENLTEYCIFLKKNGQTLESVAARAIQLEKKNVVDFCFEKGLRDFDLVNLLLVSISVSKDIFNYVEEKCSSRRNFDGRFYPEILIYAICHSDLTLIKHCISKESLEYMQKDPLIIAHGNDCEKEIIDYIFTQVSIKNLTFYETELCKERPFLNKTLLKEKIRQELLYLLSLAGLFKNKDIAQFVYNKKITIDDVLTYINQKHLLDIEENLTLAVTVSNFKRLGVDTKEEVEKIYSNQTLYESYQKLDLTYFKESLVHLQM